MKIRAVQMQVFPRQVAKNAQTMLAAIDQARKEKIDLVVFPEMCLPGYLLGDFWERPAFLRECEHWQTQIAQATAGASAPSVVFGTLICDWQSKGEDGRVRKYNGFVFARGGAVQQVGYKTLLPNYREFEESRHFFDSRKLAEEKKVAIEQVLAPVRISSASGQVETFGVLVCEDSWSQDYLIDPNAILVRQGAELLINLSCSPFTLNKNQKRHRVFSEIARRQGVALLYLNTLSVQNNGKTVFCFDGASTLYSNRGEVVQQLPAFVPGVLDFDSEQLKSGAVSPDGFGGGVSIPGDSAGRPDQIESIYGGLHFAAREFMREANLSRVVIGASGGIDSAVAAALYRTILPSDQVLLVNMPSRYNSQLTRNLAAELAQNLDCFYAEVPIEHSVALTRKQIDGLVAKRPGGERLELRLSDFHLENVQARDRSSRVLAAIASSFGGVFSCNANKAETTVGYSTLYGDQAGFLCVLADLWKHQVYELGRYLNQAVYQREVIPDGIFTVVPSAELSAAQAVEKGLGDPLIYPYHDFLFRSWVQAWEPLTPEEILQWYSEGKLAEKIGAPSLKLNEIFATPELFIADLERYWNLFNGVAVAKRIQAPPIVAISPRAFGYDFRESQGPPFYSTAYFELKQKILSRGGE